MNTAHFALRNLARNKKRTAISVGGMGIAVAAMIAFGALMEGMAGHMRESITGYDAGRFQIEPKGADDEQSFYSLIEQPGRLMARLEDEGFRVAPRLLGHGLASSGSLTAGASIRGVDPKGETKVTDFHTAIERGAWLEPDAGKGVVVGRKLARHLNVAVGDELILLAQAADGSTAADLFRVRGVLGAVSEQLDRHGVFMTVAAFRDFFFLGDGVHELAIMPGPGRRELPNSKLVDALENMAGPLPVKTWRDRNPLAAQMIDSMGASLAFMYLITYVAVGMIFINAAMMSVFERMREFGVLKAMGVGPWRLFRLILAESLWTTGFGSLLGVALGIPAGIFLQVVGLDLSSYLETLNVTGLALSPVFRGEVDTMVVLGPVVFLFGIMTLAVFIPAAKAAWVRPVEAMRAV